MDAATPWHPAVVHLPVALSLLMPFLCVAALVAGWRGWLPGRRLWVAVVALQAVLLAAAFVAKETGEDDEEIAERVVAHDVIHEHEEAAEGFLVGAGVALALALGGLALPHDGARHACAGLTVVAAVAVALLAWRTGRLGGELVYRHGAATAHAAAPPGSAAAAPARD